jgi:two-component sensor histidine kinase
MADYIGEMIDYLKESFDLGNRIRFDKQVEVIDLEINVAVSLGLILNEAITNAIKYAFAAHENGCISVSLNNTPDKGYTLQIADDGQGLPADFDIQKTNSMGFNLIRGLSKQVGGNLEVINNNGVTITISFKI